MALGSVTFSKRLCTQNMNARFHADAEGGVLWKDGELLLCRGWRIDGKGERSAALALLPISEQPSAACLARLIHEFGLKDESCGMGRSLC